MPQQIPSSAKESTTIETQQLACRKESATDERTLQDQGHWRNEEEQAEFTYWLYRKSAEIVSGASCVLETIRLSVEHEARGG